MKAPVILHLRPVSVELIEDLRRAKSPLAGIPDLVRALIKKREEKVFEQALNHVTFEMFLQFARQKEVRSYLVLCADTALIKTFLDHQAKQKAVPVQFFSALSMDERDVLFDFLNRFFVTGCIEFVTRKGGR